MKRRNQPEAQIETIADGFRQPEREARRPVFHPHRARWATRGEAVSHDPA